MATEYHNVVSFKASDDTKNKLDKVLEHCPISNRAWFESVVDREYRALENDSSHKEELQTLIKYLDTMIMFQRAFDTNRKRVAQSVEALKKLKVYLNGL